MTQITITPDGRFHYNDTQVTCALGKAGVTDNKREGDHKTPLGKVALRELFYRPDRLASPTCILPMTALTPVMGWCDDPSHSSYNQRITLPFDASHERLWRDDHAYDIIVPLGYNDAPAIPYHGSAIFLHLMHEDNRATEGCVALRQEDMLALLPHITHNSTLEVIASPSSF